MYIVYTSPAKNLYNISSLKLLNSCPPKAESDVLKPGLVIDDPSLLYPASSVVEAAIRRVEDAQQQENRFSGTSVQVGTYL
jgi:hypothetical protein